ncbi:hypothetical protein JCM10213_008475 [Rhodosporidiobolus nylandii]
MCGRFPLGLNADDIAFDLNHQYFQPHNPQDDEQDADAEEAADEAARAGGQGFEQPQQLQQPPAGPSNQAREPVVEQEGQGARGGEQGPVCPKSRSVVLRKNGQTKQYELDLLVWGLIPHWFREPPTAGLSTINAQCESVFEGKPSWRGPREDKRCVVVAQGFFEWLTKGKDKVPHFIKRKDGKLMVFAGLWDHCDYKGAFQSITSFTILTTPANKAVRGIHSRMPAILKDASEVSLWLENAGWTDKVKALVRPYEGDFEIYPVDKGVGKVGSENPDFIKPVAAKKGSLDSMFAKQAKTQSPVKLGTSSSAFPQSASPTNSSKPKLKSASPPSPSSSKKGSTVAVSPEQHDIQDETMNPDEDSPKKVEKLAKAAADRGEGRKEVEVLDLVDSSDEDEKPARKRPKKEEKHVDAKGNEALTDFFSVVDGQ